MIGELIMRLFHARTNAHVLHLKTQAYAPHKALEEFYETIVDFADSIAEGHIGEYGLIENYPARYTPVDDPIKLVKELMSWVEENRYEAVSAEDTYIQNVIDEVIMLCASTLYKLKVLK